MDLMQYIQYLLEQWKNMQASHGNEWDRVSDGLPRYSDSDQYNANIGGERVSKSPAFPEDKYWHGVGNWEVPSNFAPGGGMTHGNTLDQMPDKNPYGGGGQRPDVIRDYR